MKSSASVFPSSQHHFYSVNLSNHPKRVYYEDDETNKGGKQDFFIIILEGETSLFQVFNWMAILFQWKVLLLFLLFVSIFMFCFSVDKGRAAALGLSPVRLGCSLTFWPGAPWHGLSARRKSRKHTQVH